MMKRTLVTGPVKKPVSLKEAKEHLQVDVGWTDDDSFIKSLIAVATKKAEGYLRRKLITQTWKVFMDSWPHGDIILPFGQLQSVTHVKYTDTDGDQAEWTAATYYEVDTDSEPGRITLRYGQAYPSAALAPKNPIEIQFVCGYGLLGSSVDERIVHAMKLMISDMYENREDVVVGMTVTANLKATRSLLFPCILWQGTSA